MNNFKWVPGEGCSETALSRLMSNFPMPKDSMGEAWFMGENRYLYDDLRKDLANIAIDELTEPLSEIVLGTKCFGIYKEWNLWCHYLLGYLIPRAHEYSEGYLIEYLITVVISQYPNGIEIEPYKGFREDVLNTLGKCMMDDMCWENKKIVIGSVLWPPDIESSWGWWNTRGDISSSLFFCWKYLFAGEIARWFRSVIAIKSAHWRAQIVVWLVEVHGILNVEIKRSSEFQTFGQPGMDWALSDQLNGNYPTRENCAKHFIPEENRIELLKVVSEVINEDEYFKWLDSIFYYDYLEFELAGIPEQFANLYIYGH